MRPKRPGRDQQREQPRRGPRQPRRWVPLDEHGEAVALDASQTAKLHDRAQNLCLWHLGQGPRTRKQLTDAMLKKGVPVAMAESILAKLAEYDYVNDEKFAENYVRSRHENQRKGVSAIRFELLRKGVDSDTVAAALEQVSPESESDNARTLVERKMAATRGLDRQKRVNRLVGMLSRKGYPPGVAFQVVREALDAEDPEPQEWDSI